MSFPPLRAPQTDAEWARNTERRLRLLEAASSAVRVGSWTIASNADTGGLVAVTPGRAPISLDTPSYVTNSIPASAVQSATLWTTFHDDFTAKSDGGLASSNSVSDSGHPYSVSGSLSIASGALTHSVTALAVQEGYLSVKLADDQIIGYVWVEYEVPASSDPPESLAIVVSPSQYVGTESPIDAAGAVTFDGTAFRYEILLAEDSPATIGQGSYSASSEGTYRVEVTLDGNDATVTGPDGSRWRVATDARIGAYSGPWATLQLHSPADANVAVRVLRWGVEYQERATSGPFPSPHVSNLAATDRPRLLNADNTSGSGSTAIDGSLSAALFSVSAPVPQSRRVLAEGFAWFDQMVPTSREASSLSIGVYAESASEEVSGRLCTVYDGYTPANATVDSPDVDDRDGTMSAYNIGTAVPFAMVIELDEEFVVGELVAFEVKAEGTADQWTFIKSADRASLLKISELTGT